MENNTASYVAYAGLLVGIAHVLGFNLLPGQAEVIVAGAITLFGVIWQHYNKNQVVAVAEKAGAIFHV